MAYRNLIVAALAACSVETALPPATGHGAPPLPVLPAIPALSALAASTAPITATPRKATGTLMPRAEVAIVARARGTITALDVEVGARVRRGQILFRIDDRDAALKLSQSKLALALARRQLAAIEVEHRRTARLFEQQAATPQQRDQLVAQVETARLVVASAKTSVALANRAVSDTVATSPIDGIVVARPGVLGATVSDSPAPIVIVQDQTQLELTFQLPDRALATVRAGDPITIAFPALGIERAAAIALIAPRVDPRTRTVELSAVLDNRDGALRPGLAGEVALASASVARRTEAP